LLMQAAQMNDMAQLYMILLVIMLLGVVVSEVASRTERVVLRRHGR